MNPPLRFGLGDTLHAVSATFELKLMKGPFAGDRKGHFFQAAQLGGIEFEDFVFPAPLVGKPLVHIEQLAGEEGRFVTPRAVRGFP